MLRLIFGLGSFYRLSDSSCPCVWRWTKGCICCGCRRRFIVLSDLSIVTGRYGFHSRITRGSIASKWKDPKAAWRSFRRLFLLLLYLVYNIFLVMSLIPAVDPPPPEDPSRCQLLGPTALAVQAASMYSLRHQRLQLTSVFSGRFCHCLVGRQATYGETEKTMADMDLGCRQAASRTSSASRSEPSGMCHSCDRWLISDIRRDSRRPT